MTFGLGLASSVRINNCVSWPNIEIKIQIGLHRDPVRWNTFSPKMVQRRRFLFWELFAIDKLKSLESGRPATFNLCEVDCEFPEDVYASVGENGQATMSCESVSRLHLDSAPS